MRVSGLSRRVVDFHAQTLNYLDNPTSINHNLPAMTLVDFATLLASNINGFARYWQEEGIKNPDSFPAEMQHGDWMEQFLFFLESSKGQTSLPEVPNNIIAFPVKMSFECPDCKGTKLITAFVGKIKGQHLCKRCNGSGKIGAQ